MRRCETREEMDLLREFIRWRHQNGYEPTIEQVQVLGRCQQAIDDAFRGGFLPNSHWDSGYGGFPAPPPGDDDAGR